MYLEKAFGFLFSVGSVVVCLLVLAHYAPGLVALTPFALGAISWVCYRQDRPRITRGH